MGSKVFRSIKFYNAISSQVNHKNYCQTNYPKRLIRDRLLQTKTSTQKGKTDV